MKRRTAKGVLGNRRAPEILSQKVKRTGIVGGWDATRTWRVASVARAALVDLHVRGRENGVESIPFSKGDATRIFSTLRAILTTCRYCRVAASNTYRGR